MLSLLGLAVVLAGCYGYGTERVLKSGNKECKYVVRKDGNAVLGYDETAWTNEERSEKECREWLK
ncbi:MAG: hypothetical protein LBT45_00240 [Rickettsiales bacterium]|jgi:hypothetical protein|nr:hypothetical protein [Rickettsiales bacterium]